MLSKSIEDYLEAIYYLEGLKGRARTSDIAKHLNVTSPSASEMLSRLRSMGFVNHKKYVGATLTPSGVKIAKRIQARHDVLEGFLKKILVSDFSAGKDACELEHSLSEESLTQFKEFFSFAEKKGFFDDFSKWEKKNAKTKIS